MSLDDSLANESVLTVANGNCLGICIFFLVSLFNVESILIAIQQLLIQTSALEAL